MISEYWFFLFPLLAGIWLLIFFLRHVFRAQRFSHYIFNIILLKVHQLENSGKVISGQIDRLIKELKKNLQDNKKMHLLDLERRLGISLHILEQKIDKELKKGNISMDLNTLKKNMYKNLATALFGNLVGKSQSGNLITKSMYFSNNDRGDFFLLALKNPDLDQLDLTSEILFSIFKEQETAFDMAEFKLQGKAQLLQPQDNLWKTGLSLLEAKSPMAANLPWLDTPQKCLMLYLKAENIYYQTVKDEQAEKEPFVLSRKED
ncbi:MAG: hypothetical protein CVV50_00540 [Spirochaetae bacterium HGW-Spirochaetae-6]|jgi:hypothetical protein|nr:MAG: hypothetical protein CVV50_00540 [Spirochaetae bacterium HGW-Spirochaetae-6]